MTLESVATVSRRARKDEFDEGAPVEEVLDRAEEVGMDASKAEHEIEKLKENGVVFMPQSDHITLI